ncbi:unnamed protein product [Trichogramma brassicae]|uniref:Uncharacterized protein n=1 Tax=Trichogramma brassicae TaxID=86971 RepID=A0A6H5HXA9_9HYME|nr:unnamed protein product [Trichogramma brassicae]
MGAIEKIIEKCIKKRTRSCSDLVIVAVDARVRCCRVVIVRRTMSSSSQSHYERHANQGGLNQYRAAAPLASAGISRSRPHQYRFAHPNNVDAMSIVLPRDQTLQNRDAAPCAAAASGAATAADGADNQAMGVRDSVVHRYMPGLLAPSHTVHHHHQRHDGDRLDRSLQRRHIRLGRIHAGHNLIFVLLGLRVDAVHLRHTGRASGRENFPRTGRAGAVAADHPDADGGGVRRRQGPDRRARPHGHVQQRHVPVGERDDTRLDDQGRSHSLRRLHIRRADPRPDRGHRVPAADHRAPRPGLALGLLHLRRGRGRLVSRLADVLLQQAERASVHRRDREAVSAPGLPRRRRQREVVRGDAG